VQRPKLYAVTGAPILHSLSPVMFASAFEATSMNAVYTRLATDSAEETLRVARELGLSGLNVTSPLKERLEPLLDEIDDAARQIGAVNTVVFDGERARGTNTDPVGVRAMLVASCTDVRDRAVAVLGAGGAARAAIYTLRREGAREVLLVNRSAERGAGTADDFGGRYVPWSEAHHELRRVDAVFSCLPTMVAPLDPSWLRPGQLVLDANYKSPKLADVALQAGCVYGGGRAWLLGQALAAFTELTGEQPPAAAMEAALVASRKPARPERFVLCGMMGTGKSAVGQALAQELGMPFVDTDRRVEAAAGASIPEIFRQLGEPEFRRLEARAVADAMHEPRAVISLGGGAQLAPASREIICQRGTTIWLWADADTCVGRTHGSDRPLLAGDKASRARALLDERIPTYAACADLVVDTVTRTPPQVAEKIADEIRQTWPG
jgi:shikimate dehydrogenase